LGQHPTTVQSSRPDLLQPKSLPRRNFFDEEGPLTTALAPPQPALVVQGVKGEQATDAQTRLNCYCERLMSPKPRNNSAARATYSFLLPVELFCCNIPCVRKADLRLIAFCVAYLALPMDRVTSVIRLEEL
jgi:hypothetical protein